MGRKNYLFVGDVETGMTIAGLYTLVATCEARGINPFAYLAAVIPRVQGHPKRRLDELLPGPWASARAGAWPDYVCHHSSMPEIYLRAVRWVADDPQPGIVECLLGDADGVEHVLIDESAVFDDRLRSDASYPIELKLACRVVRDGEAELVVELAHLVESVEGQRTFRVPRSSIA